MNTIVSQTVIDSGRSPSELIPAVKAAVAKVLAALWRAMDAAGRARADRDLLDMAARYEAQQPSFAHELRVAAQRVSQHG